MEEPNAQSAGELKRELTRLLAAAGERFGFTVALEYPVKGGRLDVIWTWVPSTAIPGLEAAVPVVGFEIESSWRTRKHVKGDLLNLQDAGVSLGVIVIAGDSHGDDGLRTFAEQLVDRPGPNIMIWTAGDVRTLAREAPRGATVDPANLAARRPPGPAGELEGMPGTDPPIRSLREASGLAVASHSGKYAALHRWLWTREGDSLSVTFGELEEVLGFPLPSSSRRHVAHWHSYEGSAVARAIMDAGWKASRVSIDNETLTLVRAGRRSAAWTRP